MGCYLTYEDVSNGTLFLNWSQTEIKGAVGYFKPTKAVPKFKFKKKGGKEELTRGTDSQKNNYYTGWCNFIKMAKEYRGTLIVKDNEIKVITHVGSTVAYVTKAEETSLKTLECVGIVPSGRGVFDGVATTSRGNFLNKCQSRGAALTLPAWK